MSVKIISCPTFIVLFMLGVQCKNYMHEAVLLISPNILGVQYYGDNTCQLGFTSWNGNCYKLLPVEVTWVEALRACEAVKSKLAIINGMDEKNFTDTYLTAQSAQHLITTPEVWLAGTDMLQEGSWVWADTLIPFDYVNWAPGAPDNIGHLGISAHCLGIFIPSYLWDDDNCEKHLNPLCKNIAGGVGGSAPVIG